MKNSLDLIFYSVILIHDSSVSSSVALKRIGSGSGFGFEPDCIHLD